jgi:large subunit ribosomal protein L25
MSNELVLNAEPRGEQGKGASRRLRRDGKVPAILYGAGKEPTPISLNHNEILRHLENEAFYSQILTVNLDKGSEQAVLRDLQRHPARPVVLHMDLMRVSATEKVRVHIPLHFLNEESCVGVKQGGGALSHNLMEVEVQCLPKDLPEFIEVDVANLNIGDSIHLSELQLPEGVELSQLVSGAQQDNAVVMVHKGHTGTEDLEEEAGEGEGEGEEQVGD